MCVRTFLMGVEQKASPAGTAMAFCTLGAIGTFAPPTDAFNKCYRYFFPAKDMCGYKRPCSTGDCKPLMCFSNIWDFLVFTLRLTMLQKAIDFP